MLVASFRDFAEDSRGLAVFFDNKKIRKSSPSLILAILRFAPKCSIR